MHKSRLVSCAAGQRSPCLQKGFSLIEVLVAVAVLSLGLLGAVGMQYMALQDNRSARLQSIAVGLGREMAEMMRGNKMVSVQTDMDNPYLGRFVGTPLRPDSPSYCLAVGQSCSGNEEIAWAQVTEWLARVEDQLPGAQVVICLDDAPYDAKGLPRWACQKPAADAANPVAFIKIGWTHQSTNAAQIGANRLVAANAAAPFVMIPVTPGHDD